MGERLHTIAAEGFRGLPKTSIDLKSKSLCVLGGNGKGKSALVDAVEFAFSGTVARFTGAGTGNIELGDALRNVCVRRTPRVSLAFQPSNRTVARTLGQEGRLISPSTALQAHLDEHPAPGRFALRRAALLDFIHTTDATRHQMFMKLMGLGRLDQLQRTLREARDGAESARGTALLALKGQLEALRPSGATATPTSMPEVMRVLNGVLAKLSLPALDSWDQLDDRIARVAPQRRAENSPKIDRLNTAITALGDAVSEDLAEVAATSARLAEDLRRLEADDGDAPRVPTIGAAATYLAAHTDETACPVCEREFEDGYDRILERLRARLAAQEKVANCRRALDETYSALRDGVRTTAAQLSKDVVALTALEDERREPLAEAQDLAEALARRLPPSREDCALQAVSVPSAIVTVAETRRAMRAELIGERDSLVKSETVTVEECYRLLALARDRLPRLLDAEARVGSTKQAFDRLVAVQEAVGAARDKGVQKVMDRIAGTVLDYYGRIHAISTLDRPECDDIALRVVPKRAERGSTRLVVKFLGKAACDPKGFLSDGHLDSLGLCIFLACVKLFNREGSLLVLDDVLTSVDKEHRHRVGDLLFAEFSSYQTILTTHDGYRFSQLRAAAKSCGADENWRFMEISSWNANVGPEIGDVSASESFIRENLKEPQYRELGGALRAVFEDFVRKIGSRLEIRVRFKLDGRYTAGDLLNYGFAKDLRAALVKATPADTAAIEADLRKCLGNAQLVNALAPGDERRLEATLTEVSDFFDGLRALRARAAAARVYA